MWIIRSWELSVVEPQSFSGRSEKSCCLTDEGLETLEPAIKQRDKKQQSNVCLATECGCDRSTISKIRNRSGAVVLSKIFQLFSLLDLDLEETHWEEWRDESLPSSHNPKQRQHESQISQQVAELLWKLDYRAQETAFIDLLCKSRRAELALVRASEPEIQKWLVKRLAKQVPLFGSAKKYSVSVAALELLGNYDGLWHEIKMKLTDSALLTSKRMSPRPDSEEIISFLVELAETTPIIIAVYGLKASGQMRTKLLEDFWAPLVRQVYAQPDKASRIRLYLFLAESPSERKNESSKELVTITTCNADISVNLDTLKPLKKISVNDVKGWIDSDVVYSSLSQLIKEEDVKHLLENEIPAWKSISPNETIQNLCLAFQLEDGVDKIKRYWELAG
jgi:hypothetical protein